MRDQHHHLGRGVCPIRGGLVVIYIKRRGDTRPNNRPAHIKASRCPIEFIIASTWAGFVRAQEKIYKPPHTAQLAGGGPNAPDLRSHWPNPCIAYILGRYLMLVACS